MKKGYSTPDIVFESFSLNENIASYNSACSRNLTNQYSGSCGLYWNGLTVFTVTSAGCRVKVADGSPQFDGLCYHIPTGDNKLFNS